MSNYHVFENNQYVNLFYEWKTQYGEKTFKSKVNELIKMFHPDHNPNCEKSQNETRLIIEAKKMINTPEIFMDITTYREATSIKNVEDLEMELQEQINSRQEQTAKFAFTSILTALLLSNKRTSNKQSRRRYSRRRGRC